MRAALVEPNEIPGRIQIMRKVNKAIVVYCWTIPNQPAANANSYHYHISMA